MRAVWLGLLAALAVGQAASAEERALCADRPGKATPPCIVDVGHLQLEAGLVDWSRQDQAGDRTDALALGGLELRAGLTRRTEVSVAWTAYSQVHDRLDGRSHGVGDTQIGVRTSLTDPDKDGLAVSVEPFVVAPTATHGQGDGGWEGGVIVPVSLPLSGGFSLGLSPELEIVRDDGGGGTHKDWSGAVAVSHAIGPTTLALELWGDDDDAPGGAVRQASADAALAWIPKAQPNLQLDVGLNLGLNRNTPDEEAYVGVVRRF